MLSSTPKNNVCELWTVKITCLIGYNFLKKKNIRYIFSSLQIMCVISSAILKNLCYIFATKDVNAREYFMLHNAFIFYFHAIEVVKKRQGTFIVRKSTFYYIHIKTKNLTFDKHVTYSRTLIPKTFQFL